MSKVRISALLEDWSHHVSRETVSSGSAIDTVRRNENPEADRSGTYRHRGWRSADLGVGAVQNALRFGSQRGLASCSGSAAHCRGLESVGVEQCTSRI